MLSTRPTLRLTALLIATQLAACSRFVWHEDPFTPDQAPVTETVAAGRDTTYVLKTASYYLLSNQRSELWNRDVMDDVAWRYNALFREAPPMIAVRLDTSRAPAVATDSAAMWRGVPFATVAVRRRARVDSAKKRVRGRDDEVDAGDSVRVRMITGPMLAATAAETWLRARTLDATRVSDSQPGGATRTVAASAKLPAWIEAGALRILGSGGAPDRANAELRADAKHIVPLASLFTVAWTPPNVAEVVHPGISRYGLDDDAAMLGHVAGPRARERRDEASGASPLFIAQSVSVLAFIHERDQGLVARLADELSRGASIPDVLASSTTLPHDLVGLDAAWRDWLKRSQRSH